ncbi:MAG: ParA family protein [Rhodospirillaceae bacterium]|nr:ParA family protein [Rhodospirillaceae bacterium]MBT5240882.1 ParA family protein [Rhodospirillaceae bacterium]MBT5565017.1 ParA family protein [Rhodospirillaceae bacterium]MBT6090219.1 ParA family protein [Rhodospirillaceae bacterium]MBT6962384.1 ParA family protein [Rhodospirillaceae bacterium]
MPPQAHRSDPGASPRVLAISNQKGGVGKTTTAVNLATALAAVDKRVLIVDLDPQGNASTSLGIPAKDRATNTYHVLMGDAGLDEAAVLTKVPNLSIAPSGVDLAGAELELVDIENREKRLRSALSGSATSYDYVLIDCPPSLGLLTLNAWVAADAVLVPLQVEFLALEGVSQLVKTIERVRQSFNPTLEIQGIVLTMVDKRNNLSEMVESDVRGFFGDKVYTTVIPRNVRVSEAPSHGKPVLLYDFQSKGAQAYLNLAGEVLKREQALAA